MKFRDSYIGDSSDGEEQEEIEKKYVEQEDEYLNHLTKSLKETDYKTSYLLKDIGGRLLHHQKITEKYIEIKGFQNIGEEGSELEKAVDSLSASIKEKAEIIKDKYILGKLVYGGSSNRLDLTDYHKKNAKAINEFIYSVFAKLREEDAFLSNLKKIYEKYTTLSSPLDLTNDLIILYKALVEKWDDYKSFAAYFGVTKTGSRGNFTKELKKYISKDTLKILIQAHESNEFRKELVGNITEQTKYFLKKSHEKESTSIKFLLAEYAIPSLQFFVKSEDNNAVEFLAAIRAYHKFMRGIIKNSLMQQENFKIKSWPIITKVGTSIYANSDFKALGTLSISEKDEIYNTGSRSSKIYGMTSKLSGSYNTLKVDIENLNNKASLPECFKAILRGNEKGCLNWDKYSHEEQHYLYDLTFLLFGCEVTRNVSALISNPMFFDLVKVKYYSIDDLDGKLPMAMANAVPSSLDLDKKLGTKYGEKNGNGILSSVLYYDFRAKISSSKITELCQRDDAILIDWIIYFKLGINKNFLEEVKNLNSDSTITELESKFGDNITLTILNKNTKISKCSKKLEIRTDEGYEIKLKFIWDQKKIEKIEFKAVKMPTVAFHELISDWYGVDMSYLQTGEFIFKAAVEFKDLNPTEEDSKDILSFNDSRKNKSSYLHNFKSKRLEPKTYVPLNKQLKNIGLLESREQNDSEIFVVTSHKDGLTKPNFLLESLDSAKILGEMSEYLDNI